MTASPSAGPSRGECAVGTSGARPNADDKGRTGGQAVILDVGHGGSNREICSSSLGFPGARKNDRFSSLSGVHLGNQIRP